LLQPSLDEYQINMLNGLHTQCSLIYLLACTQKTTTWGTKKNWFLFLLNFNFYVEQVSPYNTMTMETERSKRYGTFMFEKTW